MLRYQILHMVINNLRTFLIAITDQFIFLGAMENWGLITYKEQYLIGDDNSHHFDYLEILLTIAHEEAHQFFGNLVTLAWWNYTW